MSGDDPETYGRSLVGLSTRVFALCETCHPRELEAGARIIGVEPGYEEEWAKLQRWAAGEQP